MKLLFPALALSLALCAPAFAQEGAQTAAPPAPASAPATQQPTVTLESGLTIAPVEWLNSDLENLLDARKWRFVIGAPKTPTDLLVQLELRRPGQAPVRLVGLGQNEMLDLEYTLMLVPNGESFYDAKSWKLLAEMRNLRALPGYRGDFTRSTLDNPLLGLQWKNGGATDFYNAKDIPADGALVLMSFDTGEAVSEAVSEAVGKAVGKAGAPGQTQLVLHITGTPHQD